MSARAPANLMLVVFAPFAAGYFLSYFFRNVNAVISKDLSAEFSLAPSDLDGTIRYRTISNPADIEQELKLALLHVFNHQTHHRGQVHCLLTRITDAAPSLDLILYQREAGVGLVRGAPPASSSPDRRAVR